MNNTITFLYFKFVLNSECHTGSVLLKQFFETVLESLKQY